MGEDGRETRRARRWRRAVVIPISAVALFIAVAVFWTGHGPPTGVDLVIRDPQGRQVTRGRAGTQVHTQGPITFIQYGDFRLGTTNQDFHVSSRRLLPWFGRELFWLRVRTDAGESRWAIVLPTELSREAFSIDGYSFSLEANPGPR